MPPEYIPILVNLALGFAVGTYGTLVGAGGGFLLVPLFLLWHKLPFETAVGTSLTVVAANAFSGALSYVKQKKVDYRAGVTFALATFPGAILGARVTQEMSGPLFFRVFGCFLISVAIYLFLRKSKARDSYPGRSGWGWVRREQQGVFYQYHEPLGLALSSVVGFISSLLGVGGGIMHVPAMTELLGFPVHVAVATSHFVLAWTALVGATTHALSGGWDLSLALPLSVGAIAGAQLGAHWSKQIRGNTLLRYLALALVLVGLRLIFR